MTIKEVAELVRDANERPDRINAYEKQFLKGFETRISENLFRHPTPAQENVLKNIAKKVYAV
jgi:hypothetical protein